MEINYFLSILNMRNEDKLFSADRFALRISTQFLMINNV